MSMPFDESMLSDGGEYGSEISVEDPSHVTGSQNSSSATRRVSVATYQWLIVVGALAALWALGFAFRSDLKLGG